MSKVNVNTIEPSTGTDITLGASGDTITVPSGATFTQSGTMNASAITAGTMATARLGSGTASSSTVLYGDQTYKAEPTGVSLATSTNNQVVTVTGADAITGETNFIYNGTIIGGGADGANADLGVGLHIKTADSGASANALADELVIEGSGDSGMSILSGNASEGHIFFGDDGDDNIGSINYEHDNQRMKINVNAIDPCVVINSSGNLSMGTTNTHAKITVYQSDLDEWVTRFQNTNATRSYCVRAQMTTDHNDTTSDFMSGVGASTTRWKIQSNGNMENINNSYGAISDERIKENITNANSQWEDVKKLKFKNYNIINETNTQLGVIAQDLETDGMNGLVSESPPTINHVEIDSLFGTLEDDTSDPLTLYEDGDVIPEGKKIGDGKTFSKKVGEVKSKIKAVKYSVLYMKAIKALQESMERIETLEAKVTALENK